MFWWTLRCSLPCIYFLSCKRHAHFKFVSAATQAVQSHLCVWEETPIRHFIHTLEWQQLGRNKTAEKILLDRRTRWFWHIKVDMCVIGSLTSTTTLWCHRRWAAKHIGGEGTISSRAEAACASLQQPMPRGRWVLSRCQSLLAGQQCLASFFIGAFAGSETMFYFWTYNHRGILH